MEGKRLVVVLLHCLLSAFEIGYFENLATISISMSPIFYVISTGFVVQYFWACKIGNNPLISSMGLFSALGLLLRNSSILIITTPTTLSLRLSSMSTFNFTISFRYFENSKIGHLISYESSVEYILCSSSEAFLATATLPAPFYPQNLTRIFVFSGGKAVFSQASSPIDTNNSP